MTWVNRLRLVAALVAVLCLVAVLMLVFNQRQNRVTSLSATIDAEIYVVGAAYGGTVTKQYVDEGDIVESGQKLFTVDSVGLQHDLANKMRIKSSRAYVVNAKKGTLTYKATVAGQVSDIEARLGNALGANQSFAKITVSDSQFVEASYLLSPREYERVAEGNRVSILLPNNRSIDGSVHSIKVATENGMAATEIRVRSRGLAQDELADMTKPGTPVVATVELRDDGPLAGVSDKAFATLRQMGLA